MGLLRHALVLMAGLPVLAPTAHADDRTAAIDPAGIAGITLILTPLELRTRAPLTQATLPGSGCTFTTSFHAAKNAEMLDILNRHLAAIPDQASGHFLLRNAVYLRMVDGMVIRYLIGPAVGPRKEVHGGSETSNTGSYIPFKSDERLLHALRRWAASGVAQKDPSAQCADKDRFLQVAAPQP